MQILHINRSDTTGGASVAAMRLVTALNASGVEANMLVAEKSVKSEMVYSVAGTRFGNIRLHYNFIMDLLAYLPYSKNRESRFAFSTAKNGFDISRHPLVINSDIIHIHWFNQGFISTKGLGKLLSLGKPVVWTLHDMWSFTGGCHYTGNCNNYENTCRFCPLLIKNSETDISNKQFLIKKELYKNGPLNIVTCSNWLAGKAKKASLLQNKKIVPIPNPIDTNIYLPKKQREARERLNLPPDKKIILFGAANINDPRKGMLHLLKALDYLSKTVDFSDIDLVVFGKATSGLKQSTKFRVHILNYINNRNTIIDLYNAADVFVLPSLEDNLPNTVMEALSCGLPVAAFKTGGVPEMVDDGVCGSLSMPGDEIGLANGIKKILFNPDATIYRFNARDKAIKNYSQHIIANRYIDFYKQLLKP